jgi:uncharacterized damage-inducible protein DinB
MSRSLLDDAFAHHIWATLRLLDTCLALSPEQLETAVPGTYGSVLQTWRHLVGGDSFYLVALTGDDRLRIDEDRMDLASLRAAIVRDGVIWVRLLADGPDPDLVVHEVDPNDGYQRDAPMGIRLAQAIHHGTDHRSQICTALTALGVEPPSIDVWDFGTHEGRIVEVWPTG